MNIWIPYVSYTLSVQAWHVYRDDPYGCPTEKLQYLRCWVPLKNNNNNNKKSQTKPSTGGTDAPWTRPLLPRRQSGLTFYDFFF